MNAAKRTYVQAESAAVALGRVDGWSCAIKGNCWTAQLHAEFTLFAVCADFAAACILYGFQQGTRTLCNDDRRGFRNNFQLHNGFHLLDIERVNNGDSFDTNGLAERYQIHLLGDFLPDGVTRGRVVLMSGHARDGVVQNDKLRVCFDTCHTSDSGYDIIHHIDDVMESFDRLLGKDQIAVFHINDSKNITGAAKDRHENIGFGEIGFDAISTIVHHPDFESVPKILETPYIPSVTKAKKSYAPYKYEIEMLRNNRFDPEMKDHILADCE